MGLYFLVGICVLIVLVAVADFVRDELNRRANNRFRQKCYDSVHALSEEHKARCQALIAVAKNGEGKVSE